MTDDQFIDTTPTEDPSDLLEPNFDLDAGAQDEDVQEEDK